MFFYKASHGNIDIDISNFVFFVNNSRTRSSQLRTLKTPHCWTRTFQSCYFNHIFKLWNKTINVVLQKNFSSLWSLKEQLKTCINWRWPERLICRCFARGSPCLTVLTIGNLVIVNVVSQTEAIDNISPWYCFPTRFKPELYHSTIHHFLLSCCFALVVCCVLFVHCDIMYNVCMLFILLWERCLAWVVVIVPRLHFFPFGPLFACFIYIQ